MMSVLTLPSPAEAPENRESVNPSRSTLLDRYFSRLTELTSQPAPWNLNAYAAVASLIGLWALRFYMTWATWGLISVDVGREMYVPAMLAQGRMLYRDVFYGYAPLAPYFNALLFRCFGIHLNVLYWAGSLSALACALLLFFTARKLGSTLVGWTVAAVILMESFHGWMFSFPLAYSFPSVYGCLTSCLFLYCLIHALRSNRLRWIFAAASAASVALLIKVEFGAACYLAFLSFLLIQGFRGRSPKRLAGELACAIPGISACLLAALWMLSIRGFEFITQENLASSWPGSYFMRTYGKVWLQQTGLAITGPALLQSLLHTLFAAGVILEIYLLFFRKRFSVRVVLFCISLFPPLAVWFVYGLHLQWLPALGALFFPQDMVLYLAISAVLIYWKLLSSRASGELMPIALLVSFAVLVAARTLLNTVPVGYSIYYNGPAVLSFLLLLRPLVPRANRSHRDIFRSELALCLGCLAVSAVYAARFVPDSSDRTALITDRGTIVVSKQTAANYRAAITLMKEEAAAGRFVLSVPEDISLYFLSGTEAPARLYFFAPGILAPGKMTTDIVKEIDSKPLRYVLWSSRSFEEYGAPRFGVDFDQALGNYITSHFRSVGLLVPGSDLDWQTRFTLWERKPESK